MIKKNKIGYSKFNSLVHFFKRKNDYFQSGLIIVFGQRGSGKTTNIAKMYYKWLKSKSKNKKTWQYFYSNVQLSNINTDYYYLDLNKFRLTDYIERTNKALYYGACTIPKDGDTPFKIHENSIICIDELGILFHSRNYKNTDKEIVNLIKILRKLGIYLYCNSQAYDIDKVFRTGANELRLIKKFGFLTISRRIDKYIGISKNDENGNADEQIADHVKFASILSKGGIEFTFIPFYTDLFDSFS